MWLRAPQAAWTERARVQRGASPTSATLPRGLVEGTETIVFFTLALAFLKAGQARPGDALEVAVLGRPHKARLLPAPPFDPEGKRLRA